MKRLSVSLRCVLVFMATAGAQELGPGIMKVRDGIYVFAPDATTTTCSFVVTQEGVVIIDRCTVLWTPAKCSRQLMIDTETHSDHTANHFVFSPPATVINHQGAG